MREFTSPWLETEKPPSQCTDSTDETPFVSAVSDTTQQKPLYQQSDASDNMRAFIAGLPPVDTWNLDETVARIRQLSHDERTVFFAALAHDWAAWKLAMSPPDVDETGGATLREGPIRCNGGRMSMIIITHCRRCGREFEADRIEILRKVWKLCPACRELGADPRFDMTPASARPDLAKLGAESLLHAGAPS
jgi:hypothetical protein